MRKTLKNLVASTALVGVTACAPLMEKESVDYRPLNSGCVEGFPVRISHNDDESWRRIRIEFPDGIYVEAYNDTTRDWLSDDFFNSIHIGSISGNTPLGSPNHPSEKYISFRNLKELYRKIKSGDESVKCS